MSQLFAKIGVLSDTHLQGTSDEFSAAVALCFADVDIIFHAGDLTNYTILEAFAGKEIYAVHGNMCDSSSSKLLPAIRKIVVGGFSFALTHGHGFFAPLEENLWKQFRPVDCIVFGHTHQPLCERIGPVLFVNPGSFKVLGRFGAVGTYAIIEVGTELRARIHTVG